MTRKVGIRELKARLSAYLRHVKQGSMVIITERGRPIGRIVPVSASPDERLEQLIQAGFLVWNGKKLSRLKPPARTRGGTRTVSELLVEDRE